MATRSRPMRTSELHEAVLVTIHGRAWPGVLRARSWSPERQVWLCRVEVRVDDRAVLVTVPGDQIEAAPPAESSRRGTSR